MEVEIEKIVLGGDGLARWNGIPIFVPRSAPGDRLRVRLTDRKGDYGRGEIVEILSPGKGRREAPCPHYDQCGGCDLQHLEESAQLRAKAEAVRETLLRIGRVSFPDDVEILTGDMWGYRLRHQLQVGDTIRGRRVGYFARGSHDLVPIDSCPILVPALNAELRRWPRRAREVEHKRLDVAAGDHGAWTCSPKLEGVPHGEISLKIDTTQGPFTYEFDARSFFQGHYQLLSKLVDAVIDAPVLEKGQEAPDGESAVDLFSGVGLFTLPLARRYRRVVAVESDRVAARWARRNAKKNQVGNVEIEAMAAQSWISRLREIFPAGIDRVIVDPPRGGLPAAVRTLLVKHPPKRLTYVSCHPATLARDLKAFDRVFQIERLKLIDLFPQTGHMEVIVQLVRKESL